MSREPNFNPIARPYRWLEYLAFGKALENCRTHYLPQLLDRRNALILGDGDGRFTSKLLAANPNIKVLAVDISATMLELLRQRCEATAPGASERLLALVTLTPRAQRVVRRAPGLIRPRQARSADTPTSGAMQVISTIESPTMVQVSRMKTTSGTSHRAALQRSGVTRSITSHVISTGTAVPVWSGDRSRIWVALS